MRKLSLLLSLVMALTLAGQDTGDSLLNVIAQSEDPAVKYEAMYGLAIEYQRSSPREAIDLFNECLFEAKQNSDSVSIATIYQAIGVSYDYLSEFDKAREYFESAVRIAREKNYAEIHAKLMNSLGVIDLREGNYEAALRHYLQAIQIAEAVGDAEKIVSYLNNAGHVFYYQSQFEKALEYYEKALEVAKARGSDDEVAACLQHTALIKFEMGDFDEARKDFYAALDQFRKSGDKKMEEANLLQNLGVMYKHSGQYKDSRAYYDSSLMIFEELGNLEGQAQTYVNLGELHISQKEYSKAEELLQNALRISEQIGVKEGVKYSAMALSETYEGLGDHAQALKYYKRYDAVSDSLLSEQSTSRIAELEASYDKAQKEQEIFKLQAEQNKLDASLAEEKEEKKQWMFGLSLALLLVVFGTLTGIMRYNNYRLKREKSRQLNFSQKLIEWQEDERKRIAGDLHDGVGQSLIMLKNRVQKINESEENESLEQLEKGISNTIQEIRGMSYSLRPFQLDFLGLKRSIEEMIEDVQGSTEIEIKSYLDDADNLFDTEQEVSIFRIIQECLTNLVKHSGAKKATVHMAVGDKFLNVRVTDNGVGFDPASSFNSREGFGLKGVKERVKLLEGNLRIESDSNSGTRILINLPYKNSRA